MAYAQYSALRAQLAGWAMMVIANLGTDPWWLRGLFLVMGLVNFYTAFKLEKAHENRQL